MAPHVLQSHAQELCRIFVGWKLGQDLDALYALEEGALSVDVLSGESSCDGDPLPQLFIAAELQGWLQRELERAGIPLEEIREARIEALFAARPVQRGGREEPGLSIACRSRIATRDASYEAEARRA